MGHLAVVEFIAMIIAIIALINFPFIIKRRKDFVKYLPGIFCIVITFVAEVLEEIFLFNLFAIIEVFSILLGVILLILAALMDLEFMFFKSKYLRLGKKTKIEDKKEN